MSIRLPLGLLAALMFVSACQTGGTVDPPAIQSNIGREPSRAAAIADLGVDVVRASAEFRPAIDHPGACLTDEEIRAAQLVRLHTELMVTGLTCRAAYRDDGLFDRYQTFTVAHQTLLRRGQEVLGRFLARFQAGNYRRLFDRFRTQLANYEGQVVMTLSATEYCREQYPRFYPLADLDAAGLDAYLGAALETYRDEYRQCGSAELEPAAADLPG
jgi:hypothetical protein